jgi:hypothetical protein
MGGFHRHGGTLHVHVSTAVCSLNVL